LMLQIQLTKTRLNLSKNPNNQINYTKNKNQKPNKNSLCPSQSHATLKMPSSESKNIKII
jgi:hypothetical protein